MAPIPVHLVLRNMLFEEAVGALLAGEHSVRIVHHAAGIVPVPCDGLSTRRAVVLYDLESRQTSFEEYIEQLQRRKAPARLLVTGDDEHEDKLLYFLSMGAHGWVARSQLRQTLLLAIQHVNEGGIWMPHRELVRFVEHVLAHVRYVRRLFDVNPALSNREREVLVLVSDGATNKDIANKLHISERTAKFHVANLILKMQVTNRRELMAAACAQLQPPLPEEASLARRPLAEA